MLGYKKALSRKRFSLKCETKTGSHSNNKDTGRKLYYESLTPSYNVTTPTLLYPNGNPKKPVPPPFLYVMAMPIPKNTKLQAHPRISPKRLCAYYRNHQ